jgi:hypothetical protein
MRILPYDPDRDDLLYNHRTAPILFMIIMWFSFVGLPIKLVLAFWAKEEYGEVLGEEISGKQKCEENYIISTHHAVYVVRMDMLIRYAIYQMSSEGWTQKIRQGCVVRRCKKNWELLTAFCSGNMKRALFQNLRPRCGDISVAGLHLAQDPVIKIWVSKGWKNFLASWATIGFSRTLLHGIRLYESYRWHGKFCYEQWCVQSTETAALQRSATDTAKEVLSETRLILRQQ